jgi:hypothetical protein
LNGYTPVLAFVVGSVLAAGVTRAWYTENDLLVPIGLFVVASVLLVAGEVEHYRDGDGKQSGKYFIWFIRTRRGRGHRRSRVTTPAATVECGGFLTNILTLASF